MEDISLPVCSLYSSIIYGIDGFGAFSVGDGGLDPGTGPSSLPVTVEIGGTDGTDGDGVMGGVGGDVEVDVLGGPTVTSE